MMGRVVLLLLCYCLLAGAALYGVIAQDRGYVLIVWHQTSIEMSIWFALLALLASLLTLWAIALLCQQSVRHILRAKSTLFNYRGQRAQAKTVDGLIDFIEGNWVSARKKLMRSAGQVNAPIINYLAAARSAYEMGEEQHALELLHKAENSHDRGGLAVAITQARMQLGNQQYEQALATLERATAMNASHPVVLKLRQQTYIALNDWSAVATLLPQLKKYRIGSDESQQQTARKLHYEKLKSYVAQQAQRSDKEKRDQLSALWSATPPSIQRDPPFLSLYIRQLMALQEQDIAEKRLAQALDKHWHNEWVDLYGLLRCRQAQMPLKRAEKWLLQYPDNAHLLLAMGRLCAHNQQWGRAVGFFERSLQQSPWPETYVALANTLERMGQTERSAALYKQGLLLATEHPLPPDSA